ncbi:MAG: Gfo/Idh/MocA family oxidoreductase [Actinobacteria bacterium]|nr:Gfo/Idh/MocA family oxidoreductase [Actinomycetota bacterium]
MEINLNLDLKITSQMPVRMDYRIGCIGAGFIMKDIQLVAYRNAGFNPVAIASRSIKKAEEAAMLNKIPRVYGTWEELIKDPDIEILDIAVPPHIQPDIIKQACLQKSHIKGILAQKPLAINHQQALHIVKTCKENKVTLGVNQNMRYDQSIRALKTLLEKGLLGEPIIATIEMRATPFWQDYLKDYDRLTILNMSVHHIDAFRYLFGEPSGVVASTRTDPRTGFKHTDGIAIYILEYNSGLRAMSIDDTWAWQGKADDPARDTYIKWRVEGTMGMAKGTIGWPFYPAPVPSTIDFFTNKSKGTWFKPRWKEVWFPDAFSGTMAQLLRAVEDGTEPEISGEDNLKTMAIVDACYESVSEGKRIKIIY